MRPLFRNILVRVETEHKEHRALARAVELSKATGGRLKLVDVVEEVPAPLRFPAFGYPSLLETLREEKASRLDALASALREEDLRVDTEVFTGKPYLCLIREVLSHKYDLVMQTVRPRERGGFFASDSLKLMEQCPCPVWLVCDGQCQVRSKVLAAVDVSTDDAVEQILNRRILEMATVAAEFEKGELHVLHVWHRLHSPGAGHASEEQFESYKQAVGEWSGDRLKELVRESGLAIPPDRVHLAHGSPGREILAFVESESVDLVVMGTIARTGITGMLFGGTAEEVFRDLRCSLLAIKPESFVSPVTLED